MTLPGLVHELQIRQLLHQVHHAARQGDENLIDLGGGNILGIPSKVVPSG